ncbi:hypothetical protein IMG5_134350 [Ichthyophthirius multifiliis]|uniref:P-type ATPase N-terminal domain-containing protein n=1 Tax=Ichthyophthirius multifiliis TaxID=5932 RepID=G0QWQ8_ICHMU|nr:hypothetical protein IMG5_134350 [Ichthyophthirius multifiliis]EGR30345.1 hypothetical protein IMG5_134350 [Ichthyophthirius multifiliis]|eukprot:XP_004031932.1 hypothetical protein IMG5_134350 [Ichthyophthirius multifiliis]
MNTKKGFYVELNILELKILLLLKYLKMEIIKGRVISHLNENCSNKIRTSLYSGFSLIPKTLFKSFQKSANIFFLVISLIMLIRNDLSPFKNQHNKRRGVIKNLNQIPILRNQDNNNVNNKEAFEYTQSVYWQDIRIGDILKLYHGETAPADLILLDSNKIRDKQAICFLDTYQVDGKEDFRLIYASSSTRIANLKDNPNMADSVRFLAYIVLYSQMIPVSIHGILDIVALVMDTQLSTKNDFYSKNISQSSLPSQEKTYRPVINKYANMQPYRAFQIGLSRKYRKYNPLN